jgi:SAM-dependent methyltransferase
MTDDPLRKHMRGLAGDFGDRGDALGWFDELYRDAKGEAAAIPWARLAPSRLLVDWLTAREADVRGRRVLVVGCGLGDDAQAVAARGAAVTAFDLSPTAIDWCRRRFPDSRVEFVVANLLDAPPAWRGAFDLVVEINTLQAMPVALREPAAAALASFLAPAGTLLIICRARDDGQTVEGPPWPFTSAEIAAIGGGQLEQVSFLDLLDNEDPPVRRFVVEFRTRPTAGLARALHP